MEDTIQNKKNRKQCRKQERHEENTHNHPHKNGTEKKDILEIKIELKKKFNRRAGGTEKEQLQYYNLGEKRGSIRRPTFF